MAQGGRLVKNIIAFGILLKYMYCFKQIHNMTLLQLQDQLRAHIRARIDRGELTGTGLSRGAGFRQGHLSNFLNSRRGLSLDSMDRLLDTLGIGVLDLVNAEDIQRRAMVPNSPADWQSVALVSAENAARARFTPEQVLETRSFSKSFLRKLRPNDAADRRDWQRFIAIRLDARRARGMLPLDIAAATLLVDRHYSSLEPYRRLQPNIYAVQFQGRFGLGYVSVFDNHLVVRPQNPQYAVEVVRIERGKTYCEHIVGRVCHVGLDV